MTERTSRALDEAEQALLGHRHKLRREVEKIRADYSRTRREREDAVADAAASHSAAYRGQLEAILAPMRALKLDEVMRARLHVIEASVVDLTREE